MYDWGDTIIYKKPPCGGILAEREGLLRLCLRPSGRHHAVLALSRTNVLGSNPARLLTLLTPQNKKPPCGGILAEKEGFEPSIRY